MTPGFGSVAVAVAFAGSLLAQSAATRTYRIDPARSRFTIAVGKAGAFSFMAGHAHEVETRAVEGSLEFDADDPLRSAVHLQVEAGSLRVTGKGEPADDVPKVQEIMLSERVLDVKRYPTIRFQSTRIAPAAAGGDPSRYSVTGRLTLHGVTRALTVAVKVQEAPDSLTATGTTSIKQTDYGITPVSVAGVVKVKDELAISLTVVAIRR